MKIKTIIAALKTLPTTKNSFTYVRIKSDLIKALILICEDALSQNCGNDFEIEVGEDAEI